MIQKTHFVRAGLMAVAVIAAVNFVNPAPLSVAAQSAALYKSCQEDKLTTPLSLQPAAAATAAATQAATPVATADPSKSDIVFLEIAGSESEACYLATEIFLDNNMMNIKPGFNGVVGVTKTIKGEIALDRANVANSQIGDVTINISEFVSDNPRRDGFIRQNFLESNKYPFATLTNATVSGLPATTYKEGTTLEFKIKGTLTVHENKRETVFDATGTFKDGTLVVRAVTDLKMSDFKVTPPTIPGLLKVDDPLRLVINLVAREPKAAATPAK
jgi:polyisoprenoid-binding protein YceI